jgi:5-methyltetrahydrofolate--homocysteine methyltransferase
MSLEDLAQAIVEGDEERAKALCDRLLRVDKIPLADIINEGLARGLGIVGEGMGKGEFFLAEVMLSADTFKKLFSTLKPYLKTEGVAKQGTIVIGTIYGDTHDIGKNLVATILEANGFEVVDIGIDVHPDRFVEAAEDKRANIIAISALLTTTMMGMEDVIKELEKSGNRQKVKVMVGGAPLTEEYARKIGADAYAKDGFEAAVKAKKLLGR